MHTRKITVREFVEDVRSGMSDAELMSKFGLSQKQLFEVYEKLLEAKKLALEDLERHDSNGETVAGPAAKCSECGAGKASETDLCPRCGAGDTLTVVDRKRRREVPVGTGKPGESAGKKRVPVFDTQVMEARLDVSRAARVHPDWVAPSGQYELGEYTKHGARGRRRLLSAKQIVYLALGAAFLGALVFLGLVFFDEIASYVVHWRKSAPEGGLQSAVTETERSPAPPAGRTQQDRLDRDVTSARSPAASVSSEGPETARTHKASRRHEEQSAPQENAAASSLISRAGIVRAGEPSDTKATPGTELRGEAQPNGLSSGMAAGKVNPVVEESRDQPYRVRTSDDDASRSQEHSPTRVNESSVPPRVTTVAERPAERETQRGEVPLIAAVRKGDTVRAAELIAGGVDINEVDEEGVTALLLAARKGIVPLVRLLVAKGADVLRKDSAGFCALDAALQAEDAGIVGLILPHHREKGEAILLEASAGGRKDLVEVLLANGVDPSARDDMGNTALMKAASTGRLDMARLLLEKGADARVTNKEGATALGHAYAPSATASVSLSAQREMVQLLKQHEPGLRAFGKRGE